jgi:hypothetical protein
VQVEIANLGSEPVRYSWSCPPPFQRSRNGRWEPFATFTTCNAALRVEEIAVGEYAVFRLHLLSTPDYDWRLSQETFRVVLQLSGSDGDPPSHMRTSEPFRLKLQ